MLKKYIKRLIQYINYNNKIITEIMSVKQSACPIRGPTYIKKNNSFLFLSFIFLE